MANIAVPDASPGQGIHIVPLLPILTCKSPPANRRGFAEKRRTAQRDHRHRQRRARRIKIRRENPGKDHFADSKLAITDCSSSRIQRHTELMRLDRSRANGSLQRLRNSGNTNFLFRQGSQFTHIGRSPRAPGGFFLLGHNGSSFFESALVSHQE
jgi:hypothetical protein